MSSALSLTAVLKDAVTPLTVAHAVDPFAVKTLPRYSPARAAWTARSRWLELIAQHSRHRTAEVVGAAPVVERIPARGEPLADTAVTSGQLQLLERGLASLAAVEGPIVEVGSFRGVTTRALAEAASRTVYAVDPYIGYGGSEADYAIFQRRIEGVSNITHLREPSGRAAVRFADESVSFAFVDAVHDVSNSWFDCCVWAPKLALGGMLAMHDVDDHPGVGMTLRRLLATTRSFSLWGYCPNLVLLSKTARWAGR